MFGFSPSANETSIARGLTKACLAPGLLRVTYAMEPAAEPMVSFTWEQSSLAEAAGLKAEMPD